MQFASNKYNSVGIRLFHLFGMQILNYSVVKCKSENVMFSFGRCPPGMANWPSGATDGQIAQIVDGPSSISAIESVQYTPCYYVNSLSDRD